MKMKQLLAARKVFILALPTILLAFCVTVVIPGPAPVHDGEHESKPLCTANGGEEPVPVEFGGHCEETSCYLSCSTPGAECLKTVHVVNEHDHNQSESNSTDKQEPKQEQNSNSDTRAKCVCQAGTKFDEGGKTCLDNKEEKATKPEEDKPKDPQAAAAAATASDNGEEDKDSHDGGTAIDPPPPPPHSHSGHEKTEDASTLDPNVQKAEEPTEAPKTKSNVGLAIGIITLTMFAMIFVFLVRHRINNAFRRMCGGSHPVPQHDN